VTAMRRRPLADKRFGKRLKGLRIAQDLTQEEVVAAIVDDEGKPLFDVRTLRRWENTEHPPRRGPKLRALANFYRVSEQWLRRGETNG
jgi:transcriptional regulator with XRE-family HTH domain